MTSFDYDLVIVGAGPVGLYGAYYASFRGIRTAVIDALPEVGGQITAMYPEKEIFDVAGFPTIKGRDLVDNLRQQADSPLVSYFLSEQATELTYTDDYVRIVTQERTITCAAVIVSAGIGAFRPRPLPVGSEWIGRGAEYFVSSLDAYADQRVVIFGGGDSAVDWAWALRDIADSVTVVHRRDQFRAHAGMVDKIRAAGVDLVTPFVPSAFHGEGAVTGVTVAHAKSGEERYLPADAVIAALGFLANIGPIAEWGFEVDKRHIPVDTTMRTSRDRIFAAGDIAAYPGKIPLISVGFGEIAIAVNNAAPLIDPSAGVFPGHSSNEG